MPPKPCKDSEIRNPATGRCVSRSGPTGVKIRKAAGNAITPKAKKPAKPAAKPAPKPCKSNEIRNPATGRCVSKTGAVGAKLLGKAPAAAKPTAAKPAAGGACRLLTMSEVKARLPNPKTYEKYTVMNYDDEVSEFWNRIDGRGYLKNNEAKMFFGPDITMLTQKLLLELIGKNQIARGVMIVTHEEDDIELKNREKILRPFSIFRPRSKAEVNIAGMADYGGAWNIWKSADFPDAPEGEDELKNMSNDQFVKLVKKYDVIVVDAGDTYHSAFAMKQLRKRNYSGERFIGAGSDATPYVFVTGCKHSN